MDYDWNEDYIDEYQETLEEKFYHYGTYCLILIILMLVLYFII